MGMKRANALSRAGAAAVAAPLVAAGLALLLCLPARPLLAQGAAQTVSPPTGAAPPAAPAAPAAPAPQLGAPVPLAPGFSPTPPAAAPASPAEGATAPAPEAALAKPKPKPKPKPAPPRETALSDDPTPVLQPETFFATSKASERYATIADSGGWPKVGVALHPGSKGPAVAALRRRLAAEDDAYFRREPGLGQRADRRGQALSVSHGAAPDRRCRRRDPARARRARRDALSPTGLQRAAVGGRRFPVRTALCRRQYSVDGGRRGGERPRRAPLRGDRRRCRAPLSGGHGEDRRRQHQSDLDRAELDHQERDRAQDAERPRLSFRARIFACSTIMATRSTRAPSTGRARRR